MTALLRSSKRHVTLALTAFLMLTAVLLVTQRWSVESAVIPAQSPPAPPPPPSPPAPPTPPALSTPPAPPSPPALPLIPDDDKAMAAALFRYLENPERCCRKLTMFGGVQTSSKRIDGDKFVCLDADHAPPPGACLVYSVGINNEWSFDRDMVSYGCELHCFDPSMTTYNRTETEFGAKFYKIGLGGKTQVQWSGWHMMTLTDVRRKLGHTERDIHYLKVDIEGSEWGWLENDAQSLRGVHQLGMEMHMNLHPAKLRKHYAVFRTIQEAGLALIHVNANREFGRKSRVAGVRDKVSALYELVWMRV